VKFSIDPQIFLRPGLRVIEGWKSFWFTPADPTVLGLIRICTGFVLFYILVVTTPLLGTIYAPDGWVDLKTADWFRHETPWYSDPAEFRPAGYEPDPEKNPEDRPPILHPEWSRAPWSQEYRERWFVEPGITHDLGLTVFSQWFHITDPFWMQVVHFAAIVVAVMFTLGLATRVVSVLAWVLALGYIHRTQASLFGMDTMLAILLLYLMAAPAGAALSLDRLIARFRASFWALSRHKPAPPLPLAPSISANVVIRLLQVHFCMIYLASGTTKLQGAAWWNGTAVWQTLANYEFTPVRFDFFTTMLRQMAGNRLAWEIHGAVGSLFTLTLEIGLPFFIWYPRWRWLCIIGAVILHTSIALAMGLTAFSLLMIVIVFSFMPVASVQAFLRRTFAGSAQLWLLMSSKPAAGIRFASLVHAFDAWGQVKIIDVASKQQAEEEPEWLTPPAHLNSPQLLTEGGREATGYPMVERLVRSLPILWPAALLTWLPGVGKLGRAIAPGEEPALVQEAVASR
jgi:hypothetical protein